jgi:hypothetical protein
MAAPPDKLSPADRWHGGRAREDDQAIWPIASDNTQQILDAQARHVQRQFRLPPQLARAVAEMAFGWTAAA